MAGISITLAGNFGKLDELKARAQKAASAIKGAFASDMGKAAINGLAAGAAAAFAGVVAAVKQAVDAGGELQDMMARTGAAGAGLVVMQRAFENAGLAASQVPQALNRMQKALAGVNEEGEPTNEAFAKLGLSIEELISMDPVAAFQRTAEAVASIGNPAQRSAIAMELFGRAGGEMLAVMNDPEAFSQAATQVGSLGETLAANAAKLDAVGDAFGALDTKVQQIGAEVAVALLPQLERFSAWLNETDFSAVGGGIAILIEKLGQVGDALAELSKYSPLLIAINNLADVSIGGISDDEKAAIRKKADEDYKRLRESQSVSASGPTSSVDDAATARQIAAAEAKGKAVSEKERRAAEKAVEEAERKAKAEKEAADEKERSRSAAIAEYNLEAAILSARIRGDKTRLESLEREKAVRAEIHRLESAGFTPEEARRPAEARVDAAQKAADLEEKRKKATEDHQKTGDKLRSDLEHVRDKQGALRYESSIGAISAMQRIGGGGGAVASGLDYQRQAADLQREANALLRQIVNHTASDPEV